QIPSAQVHLTALGLRGKNRLHTGKNIDGSNFRRTRAFGAEDDDGFAPLEIVKSNGGHGFERLAEVIPHAATASSTGSGAVCTIAAATIRARRSATWAALAARGGSSAGGGACRCGASPSTGSTRYRAGTEPGNHLRREGGEFVHLAIRVHVHSHGLVRR